MWYIEGCVASPIQEMRLAVALAADVFRRVVCFNCGMGCGLPVARRHVTENWCP